MYQPWFVWALTGVVCIGLEILLPGFVIFFFGVGGLLTALFCFIPAIADLIWIQLLLFIVCSIVSLVFLRKRFTKVFAGTVFDAKKGNVEEDGKGEIAEVIETVGTIKEGRIRFRGTSWKSVCREGEFPVGSKVRIIARNNMTYIIGPAEDSAPAKGDK